jgi:hypothetical protein
VASGRKSIEIHDLSFGKPVSFSPDGGKLALQGHDGIAIWNSATGENLLKLQEPEGSISSVALSPDWAVLALGSPDHLLRLHDVATGREVLRVQAADFDGNGFAVFPIAFSPDGKTLATGHNDHSVRLWEVATGIELHRYHGHGGRVSSVAFSPDGRTLASASWDTTVLVWQLGPPGLDRSDLDALWAQLSGDNGVKVHGSLWSFVARDREAVPFLRDRIEAFAVEPALLDRLLEELDHDDIAARERAAVEIEKLGSEPALRKALEGPLPEEVRRRLEGVLASLEAPVLKSPRARLLSRAVQVLERIGTDGAQAVLQKVGTRDAHTALERLRRRAR